MRLINPRLIRRGDIFGRGGRAGERWVSIFRHEGLVLNNLYKKKHNLLKTLFVATAPHQIHYPRRKLHYHEQFHLVEDILIDVSNN